MTEFAKSVAGRDAGELYLTLGRESGKGNGGVPRVLVVDGKYRKLANPKRKNPKHLKVFPLTGELAARGQNPNVTDAEVRRIIAILKARATDGR